MEYKVGDRVRIVSEWNEKTNQNEDGFMDRWLGKVMTVKKVIKTQYGVFYYMVEDEHVCWLWNKHCIAGLAEEAPKPKYKVGDRVRISNVGDWPRIVCNGDEATIESINPNGTKPSRKSDMAHYGLGNNPFIFWEDELIPIEQLQLKIVILTDGTETVARLYKGKNVIESAKATCMPGDTFDFEVGAKIAMEKLLRKKGGKK